MSFSDASWSPYFVLAPAKTSAGAPCSIWAASWSVPAKEKLNVTPECDLVNRAPIFGKTSVSDAAPSTVSFTGLGDELGDDDPHETPTRPTSAATATHRTRIGSSPRLASLRAAYGTPWHYLCETDESCAV